MSATSSNTSRKIPLICSGHSRPVPDLAYSPITEDGFFLVSACLDGKAMLRNGQTGDWIGTFVGHKGAVWSAHINSKATRTVTGSADYTSKVWDALSGDELHTWTQSKIVKSVHFSPDDNKIVTGGQDRIIRIFDLNKADNNSNSILEFPALPQSIKQVVWFTENLLLATTGEKEWRVLDIRSLDSVNVIATKSPVSNIEVSLDGKHITTAGGKEVNFWNRESFELVSSYGVSCEISSASLAPDGLSFVVGGNDFWARSFSLKDSEKGKELEVLKGHHGPVHCVRFAPDNFTFASGSEDGTIRLWQSGEVKSYGLWQETATNTATNNATTTGH